MTDDHTIIQSLRDQLASEKRRHEATGMANVALMREADEAREAVKLLADALEMALDECRKWQVDAQDALADPIVRKILDHA